MVYKYSNFLNEIYNPEKQKQKLDKTLSKYEAIRDKMSFSLTSF